MGRCMIKLRGRLEANQAGLPADTCRLLCRGHAASWLLLTQQVVEDSNCFKTPRQLRCVTQSRNARSAQSNLY